MGWISTVSRVENLEGSAARASGTYCYQVTAVNLRYCRTHRGIILQVQCLILSTPFRLGTRISSPTTAMGDPASMESISSYTSKTPLIDLSHPLISNQIPACEGHPVYNACCIQSIAQGDVSNIHSLTIGTHTGTHIDAPYHFLNDGITVDQLDLSLLAAVPVVIADMRTKKAREAITWEDLERYEGRLRKGIALLLCTGWSRHWCKPVYSQHPFLDPKAARKILERGVKVVGVDAMSPDEITDETGDSTLVHGIILGNGGAIIENLRGLEEVLDSGMEEDTLRLSALPLRLDGCDGSPIRAVVWSESIVI